MVPTNSILANTPICTTCGLTYRYTYRRPVPISMIMHYFIAITILLQLFSQNCILTIKCWAAHPLLHDGVIIQRKKDMNHMTMSVLFRSLALLRQDSITSYFIALMLTLVTYTSSYIKQGCRFLVLLKFYY